MAKKFIFLLLGTLLCFSFVFAASGPETVAEKNQNRSKAKTSFAGPLCPQ